MRHIHVVTLITCALAIDDVRFEKANPGVAFEPVTAEKSVKIKPLGKSGLEGLSRNLLSPILFPIHYFEDKRIQELQSKISKIRPLSRGDQQQQAETKTQNKESTQWFDISSAVERNIMNPVRKPELKFTPRPVPAPTLGPIQKFINNSFFAMGVTPEANKSVISWTTCEEFGKKAYFHPQEVTNVDWAPFYIWSEVWVTATVHRFTVPTKKDIDRYRSSQERFLNFTLDWSQPKLLLHAGFMEVLLVALGRRGKFQALPWIDGIDESTVMTIRSMQIHMKIEAPYLVLMHCNMHYTVMMAIIGTGPKTSAEITAEAESIGFKGIGYPVMMVRAFPGSNMPGHSDGSKHRVAMGNMTRKYALTKRRRQLMKLKK